MTSLLSTRRWTPHVALILTLLAQSACWRALVPPQEPRSPELVRERSALERARSDRSERSAADSEYPPISVETEALPSEELAPRADERPEKRPEPPALAI